MSEISAKQEKLIACLLTEKTAGKACEKAGVAVTTYWRWLQQKDFLKEYRWARRSILENTVAKLQSLSHEAIETLERNLNCGNPAVEIRCAQIILEQSIKGVDMLDVENRLEMLELLAKKLERDDGQI